MNLPSSIVLACIDFGLCC